MRKQNAVQVAPTFSRRQSGADRILTEFGRALHIVSGAAYAARPNPAGKLQGEAPELSPAEQRQAAALMRVNHVGEVCAQALYRGQALFCKEDAVQKVLLNAAAEEVDHLVWCRDRLNELHSRPSYLNPLWYAGSFALGMAASCAGTSKNLGFMAETESQVEQHLDKHLNELPANDSRSRRVVEQMRDDEMEHRATAQSHGAKSMPRPIALLMRAMAKVMTSTAYRI